ncbi:undecaprenyldiphospho-muramoylpentapeptide beta-N-acetylglucosaminyltransferase [Granulicatella adiacens]
MRVLVSGGGTGGHIYPALSLMNYLKEQDPSTEFLYVGTERGLESTIVPKAGYDFKTIKIQGIVRSLSLENFKTLWYFCTSYFKAKEIVKEFKPDIVIGTGGYVCAPVLYAAANMGIPTIIHEQNSLAGITNKFLARKVSKIAICFDAVRKDFAKYEDKVVMTGNPRGQELANAVRDDAYLDSLGIKKEKPIVLIFGGSRGSLRMNESFLEALEELEAKDYQVVMVTGQVHYDKINNHITSLKKPLQNVTVLPYINNMVQMFQNTDLVVCRSGATTLIELTALGLPSVLIPSPYVTENHQEANAMSLVEKNAATMILEKDLNGQSLVAEIDRIMEDEPKRLQMASNSKALGITDASTRLETIIHSLVK